MEFSLCLTDEFQSVISQSFIISVFIHLSHNPRARETEREAEKNVSEDEEVEKSSSLSLTVWCWDVQRTAEVVGG